MTICWQILSTNLHKFGLICPSFQHQLVASEPLFIPSNTARAFIQIDAWFKKRKIRNTSINCTSTVSRQVNNANQKISQLFNKNLREFLLLGWHIFNAQTGQHSRSLSIQRQIHFNLRQLVQDQAKKRLCQNGLTLKKSIANLTSFCTSTEKFSEGNARGEHSRADNWYFTTDGSTHCWVFWAKNRRNYRVSFYSNFTVI